MEVKQNLVEEKKYNLKCPFDMEAEFIVVHNTANDASAENEINYMRNNDNTTSFHYAVDDKEIIQGIPENRNAWHAGDGNGDGNRKGIAIEICYSKSGGERFDKAEKLASKFIAMKLKEKGWGIDKVKKHQDFSNKYCPHRTLDLGWDRFLNMIKEELGEEIEKPSKVDVIYQTYTNGRWQPNVKNTEDYAGVFGLAVTGVYANLSEGNITYKVHTKNGRWLPEVVDRKDFAGILGKHIDGLMMKSNKGTVRYRVHILGKNWLPWVTGYNEKDYNNGYAGIIGQVIDAIQVEIV